MWWKPFILASEVAQVFYVKDMSTKPRKRKDKEANTSYDEPKRHIVLSGKRDIVGVEGKTDMSKNYEKFHEIPPFKVKADPNILINDEDYPWLRRNKQRTQAKTKWRLSLHHYYDDASDLEYPCMWRNEMPSVTDEFPYETLISQNRLSVLYTKCIQFLS